jgi:hypothetical protein
MLKISTKKIQNNTILWRKKKKKKENFQIFRNILFFQHENFKFN